MTSSNPHVLATRLAGDQVLLLELSRPDGLHAMNGAMGEELAACLIEVRAAEALRAVVLTGAGDRAFSIGGDLEERAAWSDDDWRDRHAVWERAARLLRECPLPVIAAVDGLAFGGGFELAVMCDFIVAGQGAVFAFPEVTLGLFPGLGGPQILTHVIGLSLTKELVFTGRRVQAEEAKQIGLINHLVPAGEARARALRIAEGIARNAPVAVREAKAVIQREAAEALDAGFERAMLGYGKAYATEDRGEAMTARKKKRRPTFHGR